MTDWAEAEATIVHGTRGRIPFDPYPYQRAFLATYDRPRRIVLKARQVGFSQVIALEALYAAIYQSESTILLVSRSQDLAVNLLRACYQCYDSLRTPPPALRKANESELGLANGSRIKSIPANRTTGRGFSPSRVYLDEFAYADYADGIYQSIVPSLGAGACLTIGSTPDGVDNLFHALFLTADGYDRMTVPWHHCPAYYTDAERAAGVPLEQAAWYLAHRHEHTAQQWAAEYDCDFTGSGDAVFSSESIDRCADASASAAPEPGRRYLMAVDIGRRHDATVINVFDADALRRVYHERIERAPYPLIQSKIAEVATLYRAQLVIESNGTGDPVIENLDVFASPFVTTAKSKVQAIQSLALSLEHGRLTADWTMQERRELIAYRYDDARLTQDCVMSLAIGVYSIASQGTPGI